VRPNTRNLIPTLFTGLVVLLLSPRLDASSITLTGNPTFAYEGILVGPYAATLDTDPNSLVFCLDLHLDSYVGTRYDGSLFAPQTQGEKEAAFLASYSLYLGAPSGGLVNSVEGPISMAIWQLMGTMGATPNDPAAQPYIQLAQFADSNNAITPSFLGDVSIWTPTPAGSSQRFVTAIRKDSLIFDALREDLAALDNAPEPGTIVLLSIGVLLMAFGGIRRRRELARAERGLATGHRSRI
jgi:hypothetical protein